MLDLLAVVRAELSTVRRAQRHVVKLHLGRGRHVETSQSRRVLLAHPNVMVVLLAAKPSDEEAALT